MKTVGIYDAKTRLSEICEQVAQTGEAVLVTRRGAPLVQIDPVEPPDSGSAIWRMRERFVAAHGAIEPDLDLPARAVERFENPF